MLGFAPRLSNVSFLSVEISKAEQFSLERQQQIARNRTERAYRAQVRTARRRTSIAELQRLLEQGSEAEAIERTLINAGEIANENARAYVAAGESAGRQIAQRRNARFSFNRINAEALEQMRSMQQATLDHFDRQGRAASRIILDDARRRGLSTREQARALYNAIGLDSQRAVHIVNYRQSLVNRDGKALARDVRDRRFDRTVRRSVANDRPLRQRQINRLVARHQALHINSRGRTIASTESTAAIEAGADRAREQAIQRGIASRTDIELVWMTHEDEIVRGSHRVMHGQRRLQGQAFESGLGNSLRHPGDSSAPAEDRINCRCWLEVAIARG